MLVLTRKSEQKIIIGNKSRITVTVLKIQGDQVSIGIQADGDIPIYREELLSEIEEANARGVVEKDAVDVKSLAQNLKFKTRKSQYSKITGSDA